MWDAHVADLDGFPRADWAAIAEVIRASDGGTPEEQWSAAVATWLGRLRDRLGAGYGIAPSRNFLLLTERDDRWRGLLLAFLERALATILGTLPGIARDEGYGPHVVIVFARRKDYYAYVSHFYPEEGHFAGSSGMFLPDGYGHFAFPGVELHQAEPVVAHELTHACLAHLPLPMWLNEGLAQGLEHSICGTSPLVVDEEQLARHRRFWGGEEIQQFWSGSSFYRPDEGCELGYALARLLVRVLAADYGRFTRFANAADRADAGEAAAREHFGAGLGGLVARVLGAGDRGPDPSRWGDWLSGPVGGGAASMMTNFAPTVAPR